MSSCWYYKVREMQEARDSQRKENLELKRGINDEVHEKDAIQKSNMELRAKVKKAEQERIALKVSCTYVIIETACHICIEMSYLH